MESISNLKRAARVLIAEDETMVRELLEARLEREPDLQVVGTAADGRAAVEQALNRRPDVVVMDLEMPVMNGLEAAKEILARLPETRVVLLSSFVDLVKLGSGSGVYACLDKFCKAGELVAAVRQAAFGSVPPPAPPLSVHALAAEANLTALEEAVLLKVVQTEFTVDQIAAALSRELGRKVTHASVKHALARVMEKLQIEPRTRAALVKRALDAHRR